MAAIADSYLTYAANHDTDFNRKWVYWAPVHRLDSIFGYINKYYKNGVEDVWMIDMEVFRAGMAIEAVRVQLIRLIIDTDYSRHGWPVLRVMQPSKASGTTSA